MWVFWVMCDFIFCICIESYGVVSIVFVFLVGIVGL